MKALLYGIALQFKLDIRSKSMIITCYLVPLLFFFFMSGIFTSIDENAVETLIPSMTVFTVTMSALCGLPPAVSEIYGTDIKKVYSANGAPIWFGLVAQYVSSFIHTAIVCLIIFALSPLVFKAKLPSKILIYFCSEISLIALTLAIGGIIGLLFKQQAKLTMIGMLIFLPSVMLSGIMFSAELLPSFMQYFSYAFPATIAFKAMTDFQYWHLPALVGVFVLLSIITVFIMKYKADR